MVWIAQLIVHENMKAKNNKGRIGREKMMENFLSKKN
jgi:hypothetical protein